MGDGGDGGDGGMLHVHLHLLKENNAYTAHNK